MHSVKLTKIVGVESSWCDLVLAPQPKITFYPPVTLLSFCDTTFFSALILSLDQPIPMY